MGLAVAAGLVLVLACVLVPLFLLLRLDHDELSRWSDIGQALGPVAVFFSGVAFIGITAALLMQGRELRNQREELTIAREEQQRSSELAMRELHTDLIKMAIDDPELRSVWPAPAPGHETSRKDHYCNLILNLQKVAYETHTIDLPELRGALRFLMTSPDMRAFWSRTRSAHVTITESDGPEEVFTAEVDAAYAATIAP
ncbi:DUF6082 family protein [Actinomadura violacea]|uniref:Uncharacterized protein n=1 Tax=Actinomadura violacea TaxID=2819934 RepID=A0ABS3RP82_9ACTN|nr:DUF6082 family protein [Actinomadura violacea]MBO2458555.1 hypothetical protein [Actinomadura violacea]